MPSRRTYQVKEVAELSGLTTRTLHHYDSIGLLEPSMRSAAGYRLYSDHDRLRLQQIRIGRELGRSLEAIRRSLDDPGFDRGQSVGRTKHLLMLSGRSSGSRTTLREIVRKRTIAEENVRAPDER